jgi:hypothetical protein
MPKEYKERRIDIEPPKLRTKHAVRPTTAVVPGEALPPGTYSTVVSLTPGDGVLWFLRLDGFAPDPEPSARMAAIVTTTGGAVTHDYFSNPAGLAPYSANYVTVFDGDFAFDGAGVTTVKDDYIYVVWDQFDGFTAGDYRLKWTPPSTARAHVEGAILLSGVDTTSQGTFYYGGSQSPTWALRVGSTSFDHFPISVPTANHSLVYGIWDMTGAVSPPADYVSVPGTVHLSYTYTDPTEPPVMTQSVVSRIGAATGSTLSVSAPTAGGSGGGTGTTYQFSAIVFNSAAGITYTTVAFEA